MRALTEYDVRTAREAAASGDHQWAYNPRTWRWEVRTEDGILRAYVDDDVIASMHPDTRLPALWATFGWSGAVLHFVIPEDTP